MMTTDWTAADERVERETNMMYASKHVPDDYIVEVRDQNRDEDAIRDWERAVMDKADFSYLDVPDVPGRRPMNTATLAGLHLRIVDLGDGYFGLTIEEDDRLAGDGDTIQ